MRILVIGAGQMGAGIAQVAAASGATVLLNDVERAYIDRGLATIAKNLDRSVEKGRITADDRAAIIARIEPKERWEPFDVNMAVEAATENYEIKAEIFKKLEANTPPEAILASNTSSISITKIAAGTKRADRVIGMHYFNPVPVMKLVEIIRGIATSDATYRAVHDVAVAQGKTPVEVRDFPGFVSNRVLCPMINEAIFALYEGVGTVESIDTVMKLGMNHPMGPLELGDFIGLDTVLNIMNVLYDGFKDSKYRPCPLLVQYVNAGWLGKKSGRGFYTYTAASNGAASSATAAAR
jgi:3-hydroxybutyryl-CoA dehydrogenase